MNTNPDETSLALWLDDELTGGNLASLEAWAMTQPEQLTAREEIRHWRATMASALPASEDPPFPDFFNSRVMQAIRGATQPKLVKKKPFSWNSWLIPLTACAGIVLAFWAGKHTQSLPEYDVSNAPRAIPVEPVVYTPETGVEAKWFASKEASALVIVLKGVAAIPDTTDFSLTASLTTDREIDSTAEIEEPSVYKSDS